MVSPGAPMEINATQLQMPATQGKSDERLLHFVKELKGIDCDAAALRLPEANTRRPLRLEGQLVCSPSDGHVSSPSPHQPQSPPLSAQQPHPTPHDAFPITSHPVSLTSPSSQNHHPPAKQSHGVKARDKKKQSYRSRQSEVRHQTAMEQSHRNVNGAMPHLTPLHSPSSKLSGSSNLSASSKTSRELLTAQNNKTVREVGSICSPKSLCPSRSDQHSSPSSGARRNKQKNKELFNDQAGRTINRASQTSSAPHPMLKPIRPPYRSPDLGSKISETWRTWDEVRVKVYGLPPASTTRDVALWFGVEGRIRYIELYDDHGGFRNGNACLSFSPPPQRPFWCQSHYDLRNGTHLVGVCQLGRPERRAPMHPSPVRANVFYPETMVMGAQSLDFGVMLDEDKFMSMKQVDSAASNPITLRQDMLHKELTFEFRLCIQDSRSRKPGVSFPQLGRLNREDDYRFRVPFSHLTKIRERPAGANHTALSFMLKAPPKIFKHVKDLDSHDERLRIWKENNSWHRQTDIVYNPAGLRRLPLTLKKTNAILDLGRWITYRLVLDISKIDKQAYLQMRNALRDYDIHIVSSPSLDLVKDGRTAVWKHIDMPPKKDGKLKASFEELIQDSVSRLSFRVRYQLEVCISHGYLNEYNLSRQFAEKLASMEPKSAQDLLEFIANQKKPIFQPMSIFDLKAVSGTTSSAKIPDYCALIRSATVTPTTIYFHTPAVETTNRVIRQYSDHTDRFLRVRFTDEQSEGKIFSSSNETMNEVFARIKRAMTSGIQVGDRHYEYLATGNSQFREHGAYFFAPIHYLDTKRIRMWMGSFKDIKTVAKYASRLGQCFSTTRAITTVVPQIEEVDDIFHNGFNFTDGVGKISPFLAQLAAAELGILQADQETPSVFQFRLGGCKGVLAVSPTSTARELHIRVSQYKFPASHEGLDIIRWSQYICVKLNRQLILVLSALGVPDEVFKQKLQKQLEDLEQAMTDQKKALALLQKFVDHNQMTLTLASMIVDGFKISDEPFMLSMLQLWRAWSIKFLKEKAQISVSSGALLLGCVDETNTLQGHYDELHEQMPGLDASIEERSQYLPQIFVQLSRDPDSKGNSKPKVMLGPMLLARNPSLHPGDIRVVYGVDVPELRHLKDAVVLPQNGDRDIASMCSGGDLDGDDFLVIWDRDLLPKEWNHKPMDYSAPPPLVHDGEITVDDLTAFFVTYMRNDSLGLIANAHVAWADWSVEGVKDKRCLELAQLHSKAVDYAKTGQPAQMTPDLVPRKWPHFMEKKNLRKHKTYRSERILGQIYDQVGSIDFTPEFSAPFDQRILKAYEISEHILSEARQLKDEYDAAVRRIMAKFEIQTEFEVWSTFVMTHNRSSNDFKFHEEIGQLSANLKCQYRDVCIKAAGGKHNDKLGPFVAAMYKVTANEIESAVKECHETHIINGQLRPLRQMKPADMPLMSFPWIFHDVLGKIANPSTSRPSFEPLDRRSTQEQVTSRTPKDGRGPSKEKEAFADLETAQGIIHQGDVFKPFASQYMKDLEGLEGEVVQNFAIDSTSSSFAPQIKESKKRHIGDDLISPLVESSPMKQNGSMKSANTFKHPGFDILTEADDVGDLLNFLERPLMYVPTTPDSAEEHAGQAGAGTIPVASQGRHCGDPIKQAARSGLALVDIGNTATTAAPEKQEEVIIEQDIAKRSVHALLEAFAEKAFEDE